MKVQEEWMDEDWPQEEKEAIQRMHDMLDAEAEEWARDTKLTETVMSVRADAVKIDSLMRLAFSEGFYRGGRKIINELKEQQAKGGTE